MPRLPLKGICSELPPDELHLALLGVGVGGGAVAESLDRSGQVRTFCFLPLSVVQVLDRQPSATPA